MVVRMGEMDVGGALRGVNLIEKEGVSGVENDALRQRPESFVVVSVSEIEVGIVEKGMVLDVFFVSIDTGAMGLEVDKWVSE